MRKALIAYFLFFITAFAFAQQEFQYGLTMFNQFILNPAYAGSKLALSANFQFRDQWKELPGSAITNSFALHSPTKSGAVNLGIKWIDDKTAYNRNQTLAASYAYRMQTENGALSFGLSAGIKNRTINWFNVKLHDVEPNANYVPQTFQTRHFYSDFGVFYNNENGYAGLSIANIFGAPQLNGNSLINYQPHLYASAGKSFRLSGSVLVNPAIQIRLTKNAPLSTDLFLNFSFTDRLWTGVYFHWKDTPGILFQYQFKRGLKLGYAREFFYPGKGMRNLTTNELIIGWDINIFNTKSLSFRYL